MNQNSLTIAVLWLKRENLSHKRGIWLKLERFDSFSWSLIKLTNSAWINAEEQNSWTIPINRLFICTANTTLFELKEFEQLCRNLFPKWKCWQMTELPLCASAAPVNCYCPLVLQASQQDASFMKSWNQLCRFNHFPSSSLTQKRVDNFSTGDAWTDYILNLYSISTIDYLLIDSARTLS